MNKRSLIWWDTYSEQSIGKPLHKNISLNCWGKPKPRCIDGMNKALHAENWKAIDHDKQNWRSHIQATKDPQDFHYLQGNLAVLGLRWVGG